jgi:hypothetical protein
MKGVTESMVGRAAVLNLWPMSARETPNVGVLRGGLILVLGLIAVFSPCFAAAGEPARVGVLPITEKDLAQRAKVSEVYYPGSGKRYVALAQLVKGYLAIEVLKNLGVPTDNAALEREAARIDGSTKAPEMLAKIKAVYGEDRRGYMDTFVRVVYGERGLYNEVFLKSAAIHEETRRQAAEFLAEAKGAPSSFAEIAKKRGLGAGTLRVSLDNGIVREGERKREGDRKEERKEERPAGAAPAGVEQARRILESAGKVGPGEVVPDLIEWQEGYQVLRVVRKDGEATVVESVSVPKRAYDDWFWEKASKVPVTIGDKALKEQFLKEVSWARNLSLD